MKISTKLFGLTAACAACCALSTAGSRLAGTALAGLGWAAFGWTAASAMAAAAVLLIGVRREPPALQLNGACLIVKFRNLVLVASLFMLSALGASAADRFTYEPQAFQAALDAGKPILVHVTAPWCGECRAQKPIVAALAERPEFKDLTIFDVDFDTQKDALRRLRVQKQSSLVIYKGKAEVDRAVGITRREAIEALMNKAL